MPQHDYSGHEEEPDPDAHALLVRFCNDLGVVDEEIRLLELKLEECKALRTEIAEKQIPDLMIGMGIKSMETQEGFKVELKEDIRASFFSKDPDRREPAFEWLKKNDFDAIIKNVVSVSYAKGEDSEADWLISLLETAQVANVSRKRDIHHQTLLAFLRERVREDGEGAVPLDLFGAQPVKYAKVKR